MHALHRRCRVVAVGLVFAALGAAAQGQVVTADVVVLAPTTVGGGYVEQEGMVLLHTKDAGEPLGCGTSTFIGKLAGHTRDLAKNMGCDNTAIGALSMFEVTTGGANTAVGVLALFDLDVGINNTAIGHSALSQTTSGEANTAVGSGSLLLNTTGSYNVSVGGLVHNSTGSFNTAVGVDGLAQSTTGWGNTSVGYRALLKNGTGTTNTAVGYLADMLKSDYVNATAIGAGAIATGSNMVRIGNASVTKIQGQVPFSSVSDRRWKTDVEPLAMGLDFVRRLQPVSYRLKDGNGRLDMGFVAQDVEAVLGDGYNAVARGADDEQLLSMRYTDLIAPLVRALQEVDARQRSDDETMAALREENAALSRQLEALRARLDALVQSARR